MITMRIEARTVPGNSAGWSAAFPVKFVDVAGDLCPLRFLFAFYQAGLHPPGG